jgi:hypothetical protein
MEILEETWILHKDFFRKTILFYYKNSKDEDTNFRGNLGII